MAQRWIVGQEDRCGAWDHSVEQSGCVGANITKALTSVCESVCPTDRSRKTKQIVKKKLLYQYYVMHLQNLKKVHKSNLPFLKYRHKLKQQSMGRAAICEDSAFSHNAIQRNLCFNVFFIFCVLQFVLSFAYMLSTYTYVIRSIKYL